MIEIILTLIGSTPVVMPTELFSIISFSSTMITIFLVGICFSFVAITANHLRRKNGEENADNEPLPPGPYRWPVLGNLLQLGRTPHTALTEWRKTYGDVYMIQMGSRPAVILNGLEVVRQAMVKQAKEFAGINEKSSIYI